MVQRDAPVLQRCSLKLATDKSVRTDLGEILSYDNYHPEWIPFVLSKFLSKQNGTVFNKFKLNLDQLRM